ncbi:hypothetical protein [Embleya sp. NPDC050493]
MDTDEDPCPARSPWRTFFTERRGVGDVKVKDTSTLQTREGN